MYLCFCLWEYYKLRNKLQSPTWSVWLQNRLQFVAVALKEGVEFCMKFISQKSESAEISWDGLVRIRIQIPSTHTNAW